MTEVRDVLPGSPPVLFGSEGELVTVSILADPRHLEELLETLAELDFPVNPVLLHQPGSVTVEFPAYAGRVEELKETLLRGGFDPASLKVFAILAGSAALLS